MFVGVEVFCAETVMNPMQLYPQDNVNVLPPADEIKFLLTLRLVFHEACVQYLHISSIVIAYMYIIQDPLLRN